VDAQSGFLRSATEMETCIEAVALLMREIPHPSVQAVAQRLERQKGELVKSLASAGEIRPITGTGSRLRVSQALP